MVQPDWNAQKPVRPPQIEFEKHSDEMARPSDRLAAAIVDFFVVLAPFYILLSAPLKRRLTIAYVAAKDLEVGLILATMILLAILLAVIYQVSCHALFGTTIGKRLFDLKVISVFKEGRPTAWDYLLRSLVWTAQMIPFGLPFLAVFGNIKRRPLHDRIADTQVVTTKADQVTLPPTPLEQLVVRSFLVVVVGMFAFTVITQIQILVEQQRMHETLASFVRKELKSCDTVDASVKDHPKLADSRLGVALSLFAAGLASKTCLQSEYERALSENQRVSAAQYLVQAFVYADNAEVSNAYLDEVCKENADGPECYMSQLVSSWSEDQWSDVDDILRRAPEGSGYIEVWGARHYIKRAQYTRAIELLNRIANRSDLAEFSQHQRVEALVKGFKVPEAEIAFAQVAAHMPKLEAFELSAQSCLRELQLSCDRLSALSCQWFNRNNKDMVEKPIEWQESTDSVKLVQLLHQECQQAPLQPNYLSLMDEASSEAWKNFYMANLKVSRSDMSAARKLFRTVVKSSSADLWLKSEATRRLMKISSLNQLRAFHQDWRKIEDLEVVSQTGQFFLSRLQALDESKLGAKVALHMWRLTEPLKSIPTDTFERQPASVKSLIPVEEETEEDP